VILPGVGNLCQDGIRLVKLFLHISDEELQISRETQSAADLGALGNTASNCARYPLQMIGKPPQRRAAIDTRSLHQALFHCAAITAIQGNEIR
jgi:hypothetical protein